MKRFHSIKLKIFLLISFVFTLFLSVSLFYGLDKAQKQAYEYMVNLNTSTFKLIGKNVKGDLYNLNYTNVKSTIDSFENIYFKNIYILNNEGYIFAQQNKDEISFFKYKGFDRLLKNRDIKNELVYLKEIELARKNIGYIVIQNNQELLKQKKQESEKEILMIYLLFLFGIVLLSYLISMIITNPIKKIVKKIEDTKEDEDLEFDLNKNDEFSYLARTISEDRKKIHSLNKNLELRVHEELEKNKKQDILLQKQSIKAALGDMIDVVAHQWKQPLSIIKIKSEELTILSGIKDLTQEEISSSSETINEQVEHLVNTLDEFRSFFREDKKYETVVLKELVDSTMGLIKNDIIKNDIDVEVNGDGAKVNLIPNEFKHVIINLFTNTKDAFIQNDIKERKVDITIDEKDNIVIFKFQDNAGGIPQDILSKVFEANFTTKQEGHGTGVGLYMTKMIVEKISAVIDVTNKNEGACFTIKFDADSKVN